MVIAVTAQGNNLQGGVDPRFGRAKHFLIVDSKTMRFEVVENQQNISLAQGAGIQAAQIVANQGAAVVLTGNCGPKAFRTLQAAGIEIVVGVSGRIENVIQAYLRGELQPAAAANLEGHWG